jgi:hypothetical protein
MSLTFADALNGDRPGIRQRHGLFGRGLLSLVARAKPRYLWRFERGMFISNQKLTSSIRLATIHYSKSKGDGHLPMGDIGRHG